MKVVIIYSVERVESERECCLTRENVDDVDSEKIVSVYNFILSLTAPLIGKNFMTANIFLHSVHSSAAASRQRHDASSTSTFFFCAILVDYRLEKISIVTLTRSGGSSIAQHHHHHCHGGAEREREAKWERRKRRVIDIFSFFLLDFFSSPMPSSPNTAESSLLGGSFWFYWVVHKLSNKNGSKLFVLKVEVEAKKRKGCEGLKIRNLSF